MICQTCRTALRLQRQSLRLLTRLPTTTTRLAIPRAPSPMTIRALSTTRPLRSQQPLEEEPSMSDAESAIAAMLQSALSPTQLLVQDISGGCGSMYAIDITSSKFKGLSILKQQRMVNAALGDVIKQWHGVQISTKVPADA